MKRLVVSLAAESGRLILALCLSVSAGCAEDSFGEEELGVDESAISNGTLVTDETNTGLIQLQLPDALCSGTLLSNHWVLTAAHCVNLHRDWDWIRDNYVRFSQGLGSQLEYTDGVIDIWGRTFAVGWYQNAGEQAKFVVDRYTQAGDLDVSFGTSQGRVTTAIFDDPLKPTTAYTTSKATAAVVWRGKIVVGGWAQRGSKIVFALARFNEDGSLDTSFDGDSGVGNGMVTTDLTSQYQEFVASMAIDSSDRLVVGGTSIEDPLEVSSYQFAVARYEWNGKLDDSFSGDGKLVTNPVSLDWMQLKGIAIDANDGVVAVATGKNAGGAYVGAVMRYLESGELNTSFGSAGTGKMTLGNEANAVVVDSQGRILIGGANTSPTSGILRSVVWRLTPTGALDGSFASGTGVQILTFEVRGYAVEDLALLSNGEIRVAARVDGAEGDFGGYALLGANGARHYDRMRIDMSGTNLGYVGDKDSHTSPVLNAMSSSGERVVMFGRATDTRGDWRGVMHALKPDRTFDETFDVGIMAEMAGEEIEVDRVYLGGPSLSQLLNDPTLRPQLDVAMLHLKTGMTMNGTKTGYRFLPGFVANQSGISGSTVKCRGQGLDGVGGGEAGDMRWGISNVTSVSQVYVNLVPGPSNQLPQKGDSGGSCIDTISTSGKIVGIDSLGGGTTAALIRGDLISDFANRYAVD